MRRTLALGLLVLASPLSAAPQDGPDPRQALERFQRYLDGKPYHGWAFEKLVESAVALNELQDVVEAYRASTAENPEHDAARVVLARLLARTEAWDEALATLAEVRGQDAALHRLVGTLELRRGEPQAAIDALDRAAAATDDRELLEDIHEKRGEAYLARGERGRAAAAFHALAELDPGNFHLRLAAASTLAFHGLVAEALAEFEVARALAADDTPKVCQVLGEIGRLHERQSDTAAAAASYRAAIGMMARGNWLKRDLYARLLSLHRRTGQLEELIEESGREAAAAPRDVDARAFHASALVAAGRRAEARDVLRAAALEFPADLPLSRSLIDVLRDLDDVEGVVAEYQRILAERPEELELYLELGQVFASEGRLEQARLQWSRTLERRLQDATLCTRLAGLYALYEQADDAVAMYEKAIALEPRELRHYGELASFLTARGRADDAGGVLARAAEQARGSAGRLEELAGLWLAGGKPAEARAALEAALELQPDDPPLLARLAQMLLEEGRSAEAEAALRRVIAGAQEPALRRAATDRIVRQAAREERLEALVASEETALAADAGALVPALLLGRAYQVQRRPERAVAVLAALTAARPELEEARVALARLHEQAGDLESALAEYRGLLEVRPQARRKHLKSIAKIHLALFEQDEAFACYQEILRATPDNPAAFLEVANAYLALQVYDEALDCMLQAVRLDPRDGATRLALAALYETLDEWEKAERETLTAVDDDDEDVRAAARARYHEMLRKSGRVESETETLRERVRENPYDIGASLTLSDLYVRDLEYVLALDVMDRLLAYQPQQEKLLAERARLLMLLERHAEAIDVYEDLWKLPAADRELLALRIAEASLERGDPTRASEVLANVRDVRRVAGLYHAQHMPEDAAAALERGLAANPGDDRLLLSLARLHEAEGRDEAALAAYERLSGGRDSWRTLTKLASLYAALDRDEQALDVGRRLFDLIRVDDEALEGEDRRSESLRANYASRLRELQGVFRAVDQFERFADVAGEELALQPTNTDLVAFYFSSLPADQGQGAEALATLERVRAGTLGSERVPPQYSREQWESALNSYALQAYRKDRPLCAARVEELAARLAARDARVDEVLELAELRALLEQEDARRADLAAGLALHPASLPILCTLASDALAQERWAEAQRWLVALQPLVAGVTEHDDDELRALMARRAPVTRRAQLRSFPNHVQPRVSDADLDAYVALTTRRDMSVGAGRGARATEAGVQLGLARARARLGHADEAAALLDALAASPSSSFADLAHLANVYYELELFDGARRIYEDLRARDVRLCAHPLFGFARSWLPLLGAPMRNLARLHERDGELLAAYDLMRTYGETAAGELLLTVGGALEQAEARYATASREERAAGPGPGWRDAMVRYAEVLQYQRKWDAALAAYEAIAGALPDDIDVLTNVALLHERAGRWQASVDTRFRVIEAKKSVMRERARPQAPPPRTIRPVAPKMPDREEDWTWQNLRQSGSSFFMGSAAGGSNPNASLRADYVAILKLYLDNREVAQAAEVMRDLAREDAQTFRWLASSLARIIENYQLGQEALPILRLIHVHGPGQESFELQYGQALVDAEKHDEAQRVLTALMNDPGTQSYYRDKARNLLESVGATLGGSTLTLAALVASVEGDPQNVQKRTQLALRLFSDQQFERGLEHALAAEELAPHRPEVKALVHQGLQVTGRHAELEQRIDAELDKVDGDGARIMLAAQLATWRYARGERDGFEALFARAVAKQTDFYVSPAPWYVEHGLLDEARATLERALDKAPAYMHAELRAELLALRSGDAAVLERLDGAWETLAKEAHPAARLAGALPTLATPLRDLDHLAAQAGAVRAAAAGHGGLRGALYSAALEVGLGDLARAEAVLAAGMRAEDEGHFLVPTLVTIARARGDLAAAAGYLEELEALGVLGTDSVWTGTGSFTEKSLLRAELGLLRLALGDEEGARAAWQEIEGGEDDASRNMQVALYEAARMWPDAAEAQARLIEKQGEREPTSVRKLGELEAKASRWEDAVATWRRALILSQDESTTGQLHALILDGQRRLGRVPAFLAELEARLAADPGDLDAQKQIVRLRAETGDEEGAYALLEELAEVPSMTQKAVPVLIERKQLAGDLEGVIALYRALFEGNVERWSRDSYRRTLRQLLEHHGRVDEALALVAEEHPNADGAQGRTARAQVYASADRHEEALALYDAVLADDPSDRAALRAVFATLRELERWDELEARVLASVDDPDARSEIDTSALAQHPDRDAVLARLAARVAAAPDDPLARRRYAAVLGPGPDAAQEALPHLEWLRARDPRERWTRLRLIHAYDQLERVDDALTLIEELLPELDRERDVPGATGSGLIAGLRRQRAELHLRRGDVDAAYAAWDDDLGRMYERPDQWTYRVGASSAGDWGSALWELRSHELWDAYLARWSARGELPDRDSGGYWEALFRSGRVDEALDGLFLLLHDPAAALFDPGQRATFFSDPARFAGSDEPEALIVRYAEEAGRLDELVARVNGALAAHPGQRQLEMVQTLLAAVAGRNEGREETLRAELADLPFDALLLLDLARVLRADGRVDEALPLLERAAALAAGDAFEGALDWTDDPRFQVDDGAALRFRFARASNAYFGGVLRTLYGGDTSAWRGPRARIRRERILVLHLCGRAADARALEDEEWAVRAAEGWAGRRLPDAELAPLFAEAGLPEEAERVRLHELAELDDAEERERREMSVWDELARMFRGAGDEARAAGYVTLLAARHDALVDAEPEAGYRRLNRAQFRLALQDDAAGARADLEALLAQRAEEGGAPGVLEADLWRRLGDPERALEIYAETNQRTPWRRYARGTDVLYGLGHSLAAVGRLDEARPLLRYCLARDPRDPRADEARAALE